MVGNIYSFAGMVYLLVLAVRADCNSASDDILEPELTRRLLRDLREIRQAKARKGAGAVGETHLQMDNLGMMEINEIRFLSQAVNQLRLLNAARFEHDEEGDMDTNINGEDMT